MSEPPYHGLYINLDRSTARRDAMEKQLDRLGLSPFYARFPAIDGASLNSPRSTIKPGENGCFQSHYRALLSARSRGKCVHMVEDDALLSSSMRPVIEEAISQNVFEQFDVLFTDIFVPPHLGLLKFLKFVRRSAFRLRARSSLPISKWSTWRTRISLARRRSLSGEKHRPRSCAVSAGYCTVAAGAFGPVPAERCQLAAIEGRMSVPVHHQFQPG